MLFRSFPIVLIFAWVLDLKAEDVSSRPGVADWVLAAVAAVFVGMFSSLGWILLSGETFAKVYGIDATKSPVPFSQPGLITIPLGFLTLIVVSMLTKRRGTA